MSFNLELLKNELTKYGTILDCNIYNDTNLEIKGLNKKFRALMLKNKSYAVKLLNYQY